MSRFLQYLFLALLFVSFDIGIQKNVWAQFPPKVVNLQSSNIPIVVIDTRGATMTTNKNKVQAGMKIIYNEDGRRNYLNSTKFYYDNDIIINMRGQSSLTQPKKQYSVKTINPDGSKNAVSLFGMPSETKWILSAVYSDKTVMRNVLTYQLARDLGQYAVRTRYCEVILNGRYIGLYIFQEKIDRDKGRVDIKKLKDDDLSGGYIFAIDKTNGNEITWNSQIKPKPKSYGGYNILFQFVDPDEDDLTPANDPNYQAKIDYLKDYVNKFETAVNSNNFDDPEKGYRQYADAHSFVVNFLINEISRNLDGYRISSFFYKDKGGKIVSGPVWDYDIAWGNANYYDAAYPDASMFSELNYMKDIDGKGKVHYTYLYNYAGVPDANIVPFWWAKFRKDALWEEDMRYTYHNLRRNILSTERINRLIDSMATEINEAQKRNFDAWNYLKTAVWPEPQVAGSFDGEVSYLKTWTSRRLAFLDGDIPAANRPLPLNFIAFTGQAQNGYNQLNWSVATDPDADYFVVERAGADNKFVETGRVPCTDAAEYDFRDHSYDANSALYRIKEVDRNGAFTYSDVVSIKRLGNGTWRIMPNRVKNNLTAVYSGTLSRPVQATIYSTTGQRVAEQQIISSSRLSMDVSRLHSGMYILELTDESGTTTRMKFVKE